MEGLRFAGLVSASTMVPVLIDGVVIIASVPLDLQRVFITGMGVVVVVFLYLFTHYTKVGLALRAMSQDERAAMMLGIDSDLMAIIAMSLGSALAAVAAIAIFPLGSLRVDTGYNVLTYAVSVAVIGGLGSWPGAIMAAFVLGFVQIFTVAYIAPQWQMAVVMAAIILTLIFRPSGIFGKQKELEERV
jgi:branched-chain amino acid transport system permease protein